MYIKAYSHGDCVIINLTYDRVQNDRTYCVTTFKHVSNTTSGIITPPNCFIRTNFLIFNLFLSYFFFLPTFQLLKHYSDKTRNKHCARPTRITIFYATSPVGFVNKIKPYNRHWGRRLPRWTRTIVIDAVSA